jgi:GTP-binding protein EngB required for normal cell division
MSEKDNLTNSEIKKAKENGFIICGKTGAGKTTLLNAIFDKEKGRVERTLTSVTTETTIYYYKLENGKCISLIDTPGLSDAQKVNDPNIDNIHLNQIQTVLSQSNIHIKGILFLENFQNERFDADVQEALLSYNKLFPLKRFWKNIIIIFTHFYCCPDGDSEEEMKEARNKSNGKLFTNLMEKVKEVSDVIEYKDLNTLYCNSFWPIKKDHQKDKNKKVRDILENEFNKLIPLPPLFSKIEILTISDYKMKDKDNNYFLAVIEVIGFFDLNVKPLNEKVQVLTKKQVSEEEFNKVKQPKIKVHACRAIKNKLGNLYYIMEEGGPTSYYGKLTNAGIGGAIGGVGAGILGTLGAIGLGATMAAALPVVGIGAGVAAGVGAIIGFFKDN